MIDILAYAKKKGFLVSVVSNLHLLNSKQIEEISTIGVDRISVSFHSIRVESYCEIFQVNKKYYYNALNNILQLINNNVNIGILVTVSDQNFNEIVEIRNFFISRGIKDNNVNFNMLISGKNNILNRRNVVGSSKILKESNLPIESILTENNNFTCTAGKISCSIDSTGNVYPCTFMNCSAGNIRDIKIEDIWTNSHLFKFMRSITEKHFNECIKCNNKRFCHVCMANNMNETNHYNKADTNYCDFRKMITSALLGGEYENL